MTNAEKRVLVKALVGNDAEATDTVVDVFLSVAKNTILTKLYPYGQADECDVPEKYTYTQAKLAARYFLRRGAEGEITHNENGINRTYGSVDDADLLSEIVPYAVVGG